MKIAVAFKVVPDDQDIQTNADRSLDFSKAKPTVSAYDLNAIEAAVQCASEVGDTTVVGVTVGGTEADDSKTKKNALARGLDELIVAADDAYADLDARATATALAEITGSRGFDLVVCGDGSADNYAQQVDVQLAAKLGWPSVNGVTKMTASGDTLIVERTLEDVVETVEVPLPAVVSVSPDIARPRIPGMKDILAAGKKPMEAASGGEVPASSLEILEVKAPEQADRKQEVLDASADGAIEQFAAALKAAL